MLEAHSSRVADKNMVLAPLFTGYFGTESWVLCSFQSLSDGAAYDIWPRGNQGSTNINRLCYSEGWTLWPWSIVTFPQEGWVWLTRAWADSRCVKHENTILPDSFENATRAPMLKYYTHTQKNSVNSAWQEKCSSIIIQSKYWHSPVWWSNSIKCTRTKNGGGSRPEACSLMCSLSLCLILSLSGELRNEVKNEMWGAHRGVKATDSTD